VGSTRDLGVRHNVSLTIGKILTRATSLLQTSFQLEVSTQSYGPPKSRESQLWELQNDIGVLVSWLGTKYIIRGKVVAAPKSKSWWFLWVRVCPWFTRAPKCSNYALTNLLFGLCKLMWVIELLVNLPSPILELQHAPLPPKCYESGSAPQLLLLPFCIHFWTHNYVHQGA
jgi:hypothetical protein